VGRDPYARAARRWYLARPRPALDVGGRVDLGARLERLLRDLRGPDPIQAEVADGVLGRVKRRDVPAFPPVDQRVRLDDALGELVLVGLVVVEPQELALGDGLGDDARDPRVVAGRAGDLQPLVERVGAERLDDPLA